MKAIKQSLSILTAAALLLGCLGFSASAKCPAPLRFNSDGSFKIIQVSDLQEAYISSTITQDFLYDLAKNERPNLFILTGDNFTDSALPAVPLLDKAAIAMSINAFMKVFDRIYCDFGIPVTMVPGNHDAEHCDVTREEQFEIYAKHKSFIGVAMPEADAGTQSLNGPHYGTHNLLVYDKTGTNAIFNLWMFDSGDYAPDYKADDGLGSKYDCVQQPQVDWFKARHAALGKLPSLAFQHIIVKEINDIVSQDSDGNWQLPQGTVGEINEAPCPGRHNFGQYDALNAAGCLAIFTGHDHVNTFEIVRPGTDLVNTPCAGFGSYGNADTRGVRLITLRDSDLRKYETELLTYQNYYEDAAHQNRLKLFAGLYELIGGAGFPLASLLDCLSFRPYFWLSGMFSCQAS